jgi:hypothetical protein
VLIANGSQQASGPGSNKRFDMAMPSQKYETHDFDSECKATNGSELSLTTIANLNSPNKPDTLKQQIRSCVDELRSTGMTSLEGQRVATSFEELSTFSDNVRL